MIKYDKLATHYLKTRALNYKISSGKNNSAGSAEQHKQFDFVQEGNTDIWLTTFNATQIGLLQIENIKKVSLTNIKGNIGQLYLPHTSTLVIGYGNYSDFQLSIDEIIAPKLGAFHLEDAQGNVSLGCFDAPKLKNLSLVTANFPFKPSQKNIVISTALSDPSETSIFVKHDNKCQIFKTYKENDNLWRTRLKTSYENTPYQKNKLDVFLNYKKHDQDTNAFTAKISQFLSDNPL